MKADRPMRGIITPISLYKASLVINIDIIKDANLFNCEYNPLYFPNNANSIMPPNSIISRGFKRDFL